LFEHVGHPLGGRLEPFNGKISLHLFDEFDHMGAEDVDRGAAVGLGAHEFKCMVFDGSQLLMLENFNHCHVIVKINSFVF